MSPTTERETVAASTSPAAAPPNEEVFARLLRLCAPLEPLTLAIAAPHSDVALLGVLDAAAAGLAKPILVGSGAQIRAIADRLSIDLGKVEIIEATDDADAAAQSVALCRSGRARALMKGSLHTDTLMREVVREKTGLRSTRRLSHVFLASAPAYPRPLLITDAAINIYPSLDDKVDIVQNAIDLAHAIGIRLPNVALLSAIETVSSKIIATVDAAALCKMADRSQITGATLDGPLGFDTAVSLEAARIKQLRSPVAGIADVLVAPDMESGNMLAKQLEYLGGAELAGIVLGARVPIVVTSRADPARSRLVSCAIAVWLDHVRGAGG